MNRKERRKFNRNTTKYFSNPNEKLTPLQQNWFDDIKRYISEDKPIGISVKQPNRTIKKLMYNDLTLEQWRKMIPNDETIKYYHNKFLK